MVYFIHSLDDPQGLVKIGFTDRDLDARLAALQIGSPVRLSLMLAIKGDRSVERHLHEVFAADRCHGEWFRPSRELCDFLTSVCKTGVRRMAQGALTDASRMAGYAYQLGMPGEEVRARLEALAA